MSDKSDLIASTEPLPTSVVRTEPTGGEWDSGGKSVQNDTPELEDLENGGWGEDPDAANREAATDFEDEEQEVEAQPDAQTENDNEVETEAEAEEVADAPGEDAPVLTPRANERIQKLVEERNVERQKTSALEAKLEQFLAYQQRQVEMQERAYREQSQRAEAQAVQQKQAQFVEQLKQYGYNDGDVAHVLSLQALEAARAAQEQMKQIATERQTASLQAQYKAYENALDGALTKTLTDPSTQKLLVNETTKASLYKAAYAIARDQQLGDPNEAVKQAVAPILAELKASKQPVATKRPSPKDTTHKVIAASGRAAGRASGTRASGVKPMARDVKAFLK